MDGNKRTAFLTGFVFLYENGQHILAEQAEVIAAMLSLADHTLDETGLRRLVAGSYRAAGTRRTLKPMPRRIERHLLDGPAGKLEALLDAPEDAAPRAIAVVCHPHPLFGGTMHNKVVYRVARALRNSGYVVLRFNFRGVGKSEGRHDLGVGEIAGCTRGARLAAQPLSGFALHTGGVFVRLAGDTQLGMCAAGCHADHRVGISRQTRSRRSAGALQDTQAIRAEHARRIRPGRGNAGFLRPSS